MKRVLVTGATGFIGRQALLFLAARGFDIHAVGRQKPAGAAVTFHEADLLEPEQVRPVVARIGADYLLHLAWYAEPGQFWKSDRNLLWVAASLDLVRSFALAGGKRIVAAGTCAEYEWGAPRFNEYDTPCRPATLYGAAKDGLRRILDAYAMTAGLSFAWGRVFYLYGPGEKPGRLVSDAVESLLAGRRFPTSEGRQRRDFMHVCDVGGAFAALLDATVEGPVNIGSGKAAELRTLLETIGAATGRPELLAFGERSLAAGEPPSVEADVQRLRDEVGFVPSLELNEGLVETVDWWRRQGKG